MPHGKTLEDGLMFSSLREPRCWELHLGYVWCCLYIEAFVYRLFFSNSFSWHICNAPKNWRAFWSYHHFVQSSLRAC